MSEQPPRFDDERFQRAMEELFYGPSMGDKETDVPPAENDDQPGRDEVPDTM